jgi:hypothetical protein
MRTRAVLSGILLGSAALLPAPSRAQQLPEDSAIVVATAKYVRRMLHSRSAQFDPRVIPDPTTGELDVLSALPYPTRDPGVVKAITNVLSAAVWPLDSGDVCSESECKLKPHRLVLRFGPATLRGTEATIWVYSFQSDEALGVDVMGMQLLLTQRGAGWRVAKRLRRFVT